jgi:hypothetical protein
MDFKTKEIPEIGDSANPQTLNCYQDYLDWNPKEILTVKKDLEVQL